MEGRSKARRGYFQSPTAVALASTAPAPATSSIQAVREPDVQKARKPRSSAVRTKSPPVTSTSFRSQRVAAKDPFQVGSRVVINSKLSTCPRRGSVHAVCFGSLKVKLDFGTSVTVNRECCTLEGTSNKKERKPAAKRSTSAERIPRSRVTLTHRIPQEVPHLAKKKNRSSETMGMARPEPTRLRSRSNERERDAAPKRTSSAEAAGRRSPESIRKSPADTGRRSLHTASHAKVGGRAISPPRLSTLKTKLTTPKSASTEFSHYKPKMRERSPEKMAAATNGNTSDRPSSPVKKRPQSPTRKHSHPQHKSTLDFSASTQIKREGRAVTKGKTSIQRSHTHSHPQPLSYDSFFRGDSIPRQKLNYGEGGYSRLSPADILSNRYELVSLLGRGQSSTVWFAKDLQKENETEHQYVAIKVTKCAKNIRCSSLHEIALLYFIRHNSTTSGVGVAQLLNHFEHDGMHGIHVCMVFELLGHPLDVLMAQSGFKGIRDIPLIKDITVSILKALRQLKLFSVVHTDMKPENLMFIKPSADVLAQVDKKYRPGVGTRMSLLEDLRAQRRVKISDFGLSFLLKSTDGKRHTGEDLTEGDLRLIKASNYVKGALIQTREYRAPEIILGNHFTCETDIWSLACIVYEMVTGRFLFDPKSKPGVIDEHTNDIQHLAEITQTIGSPELRVINPDEGVYVSKFYTKSGLTRGTLNHKICDMKIRIHEAVPNEEEAKQIINFITSCLTWSPDARPDAGDCLNHTWLRGPNG